MSIDDPRKKKKKVEEVHRIEHTELSPSTSAGLPSVPSVPSGDSILERLGREHTAAIERQKCNELSFRPTSLREHVRVPHNSEDIMLCSWSYLMKCLRSYVGEYFSYAGAWFPEIDELSVIEKCSLLKSAAVRIYLLEAHFHTAKIFGTSQGQRCMVTLTTCLDRDNLKFLIQDANPVSRHGDIVNSMAYYMERLMGIVWPALDKFTLTDTEYHALFGLVVWQIDPCQKLSERLFETAVKIRQDIYVDLRRYYREELKVKDFSVRMGNLMTLEHLIQEANALMAEEIQTYNLLDMLRADISFLQVVLQIKI